jgi:hypothetical protein
MKMTRWEVDAPLVTVYDLMQCVQVISKRPFLRYAQEYARNYLAGNGMSGVFQ